MAISGAPRLELGQVARAQYVMFTVLVEPTRRTTGQPGGDINSSRAAVPCDWRSGTIVLVFAQ